MIKHSFSKYRDIEVSKDMMIRVDLDCELARMSSYEQLLSEWGTQFKHSKSYPNRYLKYIGDERCYDAAMNLAKRTDLVYCEGVVLFMSDSGTVYPMGHGWCTTRTGNVVDPTLFRHQTHPRLEYLGIPIRKEFIASWSNIVGYAGVLDGYPDGRPSPLYEVPAIYWYEAIDYDD